MKRPFVAPTQSDVERAEELISAGQQLLNSRHYCPLECVQPKSSELQRMCQLLEERLSARLATLVKCRALQQRIERVSRLIYVNSFLRI